MNLLPRPEAPGPSTGAAVDLPAGLAWPGHEQGRPATLMAALARNALLHANEVAVRERDHGIWQEWTWRNLLTDVLALAAALERRGVGAGSAVTSIGDNRYRIYASMLGVMTLRAFPVPVFPDVPPAELEHYTRHGAPDVAIAEDQEQVDKLLDLRERIGRPSLIVYDDARGLAPYRASGLLSCDELLREGRQRLAAEPDLAADLVCRAQAADLAVLLHSSGTTGQPKGVPLTHDNVVQGVTNALNGGYFQEREEHYAYLPTAWVGDFVFTLGAGVLLRFVDQHPRAPGDCAARPARGLADDVPGRAARLGQHAHAHPGGHAGVHTAEAPAVRLVHAASHRAGAPQARGPRADRGRALHARARRGAGVRPAEGLARPGARTSAPIPAARRWAKTPSCSSARWASI